MKSLQNLFLISMAAMLFVQCQNSTKNIEFTELEGDYFSITPPKLEAEVFAHDLLANSINITFSPNGKEFFFVRDIDSNNTGDIHWMRQINGKWTKPVSAPFNSKFTDNDICFSPDGNRVYFRSWRPIEGKTKEESASLIWTSNNHGGIWSKPELVVFQDNYLKAGYPSVSLKDNLFFPRRTNRINNYGDLFYLENKKGGFSEPIPLNNDPNNDFYEGDMCVAPDESYVITSCWDRPDSLNGGPSDLYISFKLSNDSWSELIKLGKTINSELSENCPTISADGKFFFFNRYDGVNSDAFWVSTDLIANLKKEKGF